jgi:hypothetical protein
VEYKTRGPQSLRPRVGVNAVLVTEPQFLNQPAVRLDVRPTQIVQQSLALAYHLQEALATVMILFVLTKMIREVIDALGQDRYLNLGRTGIAVVRPVLLNRWRFIESHSLKPLSLNESNYL